MSNYLFVISFQLTFYKTLRCSLARPQAIKNVDHHANGRFNWLMSERQSVNPSREAISILSGKYKTFTFVHPVKVYNDKTNFFSKSTLLLIKIKQLRFIM